MEAFSNWFWNDWFWFPEGNTFNDTRCNDGVIYARPIDLYALPLFGIGLRLLRYPYERYIAVPLAKWLHNVPADGKHETNGKVCQVHNGTNDLPKARANGHHATGIPRRRTEKIARKTEVAILKFTETSWKCLLHTFLFTFGICILSQSSWLLDNKQSVIGYPKHELWLSLYFLYMLEGAYYISLLMTIATDVKRKDWTMELIHHIAAICLISFSYATNQTRIGSLLMTLHRVADMLLQITKLLLYANHKTMANCMFVFFVLVFLFTRLYVYPFHVLYTAIVTWSAYIAPCPWWVLGNGIALGLQVLHVLWAVIILKMAFKLRKGPLNRDDRSDTEDEVEDSPSKPHMNGKTKKTD
ncbi:ceramide synthase 4-like [Clavelina lepadiformis]|uniref:ceramide synthase 4-like n=1 Tax=Clavelina lepadiformis TaxID=159417 RepID=UPI004042BB1E